MIPDRLRLMLHYMTLVGPMQGNVDPLLANLLAAVASGARAPMITVLANSFVLRGQLTTEHWFRETSLEHRRKNLESSPEYKKADAATRQSLMRQVEEMAGALGSSGDASTGVLNLVYVTAISPAGITSYVPAMRVPAPAVTAWALVDFPLPQAKSGSGGVGVGVGVVVPLD
jgi:hypothetical protein